MKFKFSLKWLLASVAIVAIASAALVNATQAWSQVMFAVALVLVLSSILAAVYTGRGFYAGFSLFAGAYWLLAVPPAWGDHFAEQMPPWSLTEYAYGLISRMERVTETQYEYRATSDDGGSKQAVTSTRTIRRPPHIYFRGVAQSCVVIRVGLLGGIIGVYIKAATIKGTPSDSASVRP